MKRKCRNMKLSLPIACLFIVSSQSLRYFSKSIFQRRLAQHLVPGKHTGDSPPKCYLQNKKREASATLWMLQGYQSCEFPNGIQSPNPVKPNQISLESYSSSAREYWKDKLGPKYSTPATLKRLIGIVVFDKNNRKWNENDPFLDVKNIDAAMCDLENVLPRNCNTARIASRYPAILREIVSSPNKIRVRVKNIQSLLPGINGDIDSDNNGYGPLLERVPTSMFLKPSVDMTRGSILDEKIETLAKLLFPTKFNTGMITGKAPSNEWELCRAKAVFFAPYLLAYSISKIRLHFDQLPKTMVIESGLVERKAFEICGKNIEPGYKSRDNSVKLCDVGSNFRASNSLDKKTAQLRTILNVSTGTAKSLIRRVPSLAGMSIENTIANRCDEMANILQCSKKEFVTVVKRHPSILTMKAETVATKLLVLNNILFYSDIETSKLNDPLVRKEITISPKTLAVARRVPALLMGDLAGNISIRADSLRYLLLGTKPLDKQMKSAENDAFAKVIRRCPELLLLDVEKNTAPKLKELSNLLSLYDVSTATTSLIGSNESGARLALREPRLLMYDIKESLVPKAKMWLERVANQVLFATALAKYPTLLMYSYGASARLEYFSTIHLGYNPDVAESRQLLMMSKQSLEDWGVVDTTSGRNVPTILRRGVPYEGQQRVEEKFKAAMDAKSSKLIYPRHTALDSNTFWKEKYHHQIKLDEMKVEELRSLLKSMGGKPAMKRKHQLIDRILELGYADDDTTKSQDNIKEMLSYKEWMASRLCCPTFNGLPEHNHEFLKKLFYRSKRIQIMADNLTVGELEKLYGMSLRGIMKAKEAKKNLKKDIFGLAKSAEELTFRSFVQDRTDYDQALRSFAISEKGKSIGTLLPNLDLSELVTEYPKLLLMSLSVIETQICQLKLLFPDTDVGSIIIGAPQLLDPNVEFKELKNRISDLYLILAPISNKQLFRIIMKEPRLLLPIKANTPQIMHVKIKYMLQAVGPTQRNDLLKYFLKYPEIILCERSALCRLEFLMGGDFMHQMQIESKFIQRIRAVNFKDIDAETISQGLGTKPFTDTTETRPLLAVGQISAVVRRDSSAMLARHPEYSDFVKESLENSMNDGKPSNFKDFEEMEDVLGTMLVEYLLGFQK